MAIKLLASYSKRLGLPGYSSHQFSVSIEAELTGVENIAGESARLYETLQQSVDEQIRNAGYVPGESPGINGDNHTANGNGNVQWQCSDKQREFILRIVGENHLDKAEIESLAHERFSKTVKQLNRLEASGLIDEMLEKYAPEGGRALQPRQAGRRRNYAKGGQR